MNTYRNLNHFTPHCQDFKKQADLKKELNALGECAQWIGRILFYMEVGALFSSFLDYTNRKQTYGNPGSSGMKPKIDNQGNEKK